MAGAKHKAEKPSGFPQADQYQMLAYSTALGLTAGHLVYAAGNEEACQYLIRNADVRVSAHTLPLDAPAQDLMRATGGLAQEMHRPAAGMS